MNDTPIVEITIFKHDEDSYQFWVDGLNGRVDWDLFDSFRNEMVEEGYYSHPEVKPIIQNYEHGKDGAITFTAELVKIDMEAQHGTGEGEIHTLPGYYTITNCSVKGFEPLTIRRPQIRGDEQE